MPTLTRLVPFGLVAFLAITFVAILHPRTRHTICNTPYAASVLHPESQPTQYRTLHFLLPIDKVAAKEPAFCKTLLSALVHGYEPTILNWDVEGDYFFMQRGKVAAVHNYLTNLTDTNTETNLVFMMDALDAWIQLSPKTLIERFDELGTSGVVTGGDTLCWPNESESFACKEAPASPLPKGVYGSNEEPRWSNSGTVLGSVAAMRTLYKDLVDIIEDPEWHIMTDQSVFNDFLATGRLTIDYHTRLFWATFVPTPSRAALFLNTPYHIDSVIPHVLYPPLVYHAQTGEVPAVVHFNGPDKGLVDQWWGKLWWQKVQGEDERFKDIVSSRLKGAVVKFAGGGSKTWRELCPQEAIGI